ncbi:MAG: DUF6781 family protein [Pseudomonadota bacterium]
MDAHSIPVETLETIKQEARQAGADGLDIHARIHEITLRALEQRKLSVNEIKAVLASVSAGINLGLAERGGDITQSLREAINGMDQAVVKFAQSTQLMIQEMLGNGREFRTGELQQSLQALRETERMLMDALRQAATTSTDLLVVETNRVASHLKASGSDAGGQARETLSLLVTRLRATAHAAKTSAGLAVRDVSSRMALVASGVLTGAGEALRNKAK